jgi:hypothetical protein
VHFSVPLLTRRWLPLPLIYASVGLYFSVWGFSELRELCRPEPPHLDVHPIVSTLDLVLQLQRNSVRLGLISSFLPVLLFIACFTPFPPLPA